VIVPGAIASVWSAFGIALSDVRYTRERDVQFVSPIDAAELESVYAGVEAELGELVAESGFSGEPRLRRYARLRYEWQRNELEIPVPEGKLDDARVAELIRDFEHRYESRYGPAALLPGARFEIVNIRAEALQETGLGAASQLAISNGSGGGEKTRPVAFERGSEPVETPVFAGGGLEAEREIEGPAVIDLPTTGILVPPGAVATRTGRGDFELTFRR